MTDRRVLYSARDEKPEGANENCMADEDREIPNQQPVQQPPLLDYRAPDDTDRDSRFAAAGLVIAGLGSLLFVGAGAVTLLGSIREGWWGVGVVGAFLLLVGFLPVKEVASRLLARSHRAPWEERSSQRDEEQGAGH
jgi:hypothetical protein